MYVCVLDPVEGSSITPKSKSIKKQEKLKYVRTYLGTRLHIYYAEQ